MKTNIIPLLSVLRKHVIYPYCKINDMFQKLKKPEGNVIAEEINYSDFHNRSR